MQFASEGNIRTLEKRLAGSQKGYFETKDLEEALLTGIKKGHEDVIPPLVVAGARRLDCALFLAMQLECIKAIGILLLCKATITGDCQAIHSLLSEPPDSENVPWYMSEVHKVLSRHCIKMHYPIAVSIMEKNYEATRELLLRTDLDMSKKQVDWSKLKLTLLHASWIYSITPWVVTLKLVNNHLRTLPVELYSASQLRRLDLSHNLLEIVPAEMFNLANIEYLNLANNKLREIPDTCMWSHTLLELNLSSNKLQTLPLGIQNSSLEILDLSHNKFTVIPKCLCRIRSLTSLDLNSMPISSLPKEMENLDHLVNLNVSNANISDLPGAGVFRGGIRGVFRARARSSKPCHYVKLVVLCHSNKAKGAVFHKLKQPTQGQIVDLPDIVTFQWSYRPLIKLFNAQKLHFNTWLLGSLAEHRAVYPCIFTSSALYSVVLDANNPMAEMREQVKPYLDSLVCYLPNANVIVLCLLLDGSDYSDVYAENCRRRMSTFLSKQSYQTLCYHGLFFISGTNVSKEQFQSDIKQRIYDVTTSMTVNKMPVVGRPYPENYYSLIPLLEKEQTAFAKRGKPGVLDENAIWAFFERALQSDAPDKTELPVMIEFLQSVGYLLHYEDPNDSLDQYYFIRPDWLYASILKVVAHVRVRSNLVISTNELLSLDWPKDIGSAFIRLMTRFAIVLQVDNKHCLMPFLLPNINAPSDLAHVGSLRRQFAPKTKALPTDLWYRLITLIYSRILTGKDISFLEIEENTSSDDVFQQSSEAGGQSATVRPCLAGVTNENSEQEKQVQLQQISPAERRVKLSQSRRQSCAEPISLARDIKMWSTGIRYGDKFSVYGCVCDISAVEEKGIEISCPRSDAGRVMLSRLCKLVQKFLEERYPLLYSVEVPLHQHEITQLASCPQCLDNGLPSVTTFLVEACVHSLSESKQNCRNHPTSVPIYDLIPDYLLVDLPSRYHYRESEFTISDDRPLHKSRRMVLYEGMLSGKSVAVKQHLELEAHSHSLPLNTISREIEMLLRLSHPNVVQTYGFCLQPVPYVILEKAPLGNLHQKLMDSEEKISRVIRFHISRQVASALEYLHHNGIVYRTLKSSSVLVWSLLFEDEVSIKLTNLDRAGISSPSGMMGGMFFSSHPAPEMLRYSFREEYSEKVDIYSFGILLYELVTRWQPVSGRYSTHRLPLGQSLKLSSGTSGYGTFVQLMQDCWNDEPSLRPSASVLVKKLCMPSFQCHLTSQVLRDCVSVRGCCFVPSVRQIWVYGEYNRGGADGSDAFADGTQVFILNSDDLTIQGSLELKETANAIFTVDSKVWIGMTEACVHAYDTATFQFTDRFYLKDSITAITTNDSYAFVALANGQLTYYHKLQFPKMSMTVEVGKKAILAMIAVGNDIWLGCGNELVILTAEDSVDIERRLQACERNESLYSLVLSKDGDTVWSLQRGSCTITTWDVSTASIKQSLNLNDDLRWICCELNYDPAYLRMVSMESSSDTLWVGLTCGVVVVLSACDSPKVITHFLAHKQSPKCLMEIPMVEYSHRECSVVLSGGFGEVSSMTNHLSESSGVIMLWQALSAWEFSLLEKRHNATTYRNT